MFSYNKYELGKFSRFALSSVQETKPYLLVYDRVPDDDQVDVPPLAEHFRLVQYL